MSCQTKPKGVLYMREGLIPAVLGTVVSASGATMMNSKYKLVGIGILGFGLAHIILGAIDLVEHR
jgi:ABC-type transport system involved in cytochrome c biogenesis permease subunit